MTDDEINAAIADATGWTAIWGERCDPDYCNDLNEMHEAEKALTQEQITDYVIEVMQFSHEPMLSTARQRAEAFLRTLGKWEEAQK